MPGRARAKMPRLKLLVLTSCLNSLGLRPMAEQLQLFQLGTAPALAQDSSKSPLERCGDKAYHDALLSYFRVRLQASEQRMNQFYSRWRANELKMQAYINLPDYEQLLKQMNQEGKPPSPVSITFPYAYATAWTIVTYLIHTYCGRKPMFQIAPGKGESVKAAMNLERLLQWNADTTRLIRYMFQWFMDAQIYGVGIVRTLWKVKKSMRSQIIKPQGIAGILASLGRPGAIQRQKVEKITFEGNDVEAVDPFMFFPDPNVPMSEVNRKGEYVFWRSFVGKHILLQAQAQGQLRWVERVQAMSPYAASWGSSNNHSARGMMTGGDSIAAMSGANRQLPAYQLDQGSCIVIPKELGLSDSTVPERWLVGIVNRTQIVQLEPLDVEYDMHPVSVIEPDSFGYGFGQPGLVDFISPIQDVLSWLLNSHIHNVRSVLNNSFIVDPSMIEMQDLKNPEPGKIIRLKRSAIGQDVRTAIMQLNVQDVTQNHIGDIEVFRRVADTISAVSDNVRGLQDSGGRKTATEVRTSAEAGASRLAAKARLISAQGMVDLTEQMSINLQSKLSQEVYLSVLGSAGMNTPTSIGPESIMGDFYYPTHDGTLPLDKVALLDSWKEILMGVAQDPELRSQFSVPSIFEFVAKLGGADNIEQFKVQVAPEPQQDAVPIGAMR